MLVDELKDIIKQIQDLREVMNRMLEEKRDLLDKDVFEMSIAMDGLINKYEKLIAQSPEPRSLRNTENRGNPENFNDDFQMEEGIEHANHHKNINAVTEVQICKNNRSSNDNNDERKKSEQLEKSTLVP